MSTLGCYKTNYLLTVKREKRENHWCIFWLYSSGQIRDTYDELMAKKQAEKEKKTAALKQKLILVILVLIIIIGANVGFIYMRWKGEQEKERSE